MTMHPVIVRRLAEQEERIQAAAEWARRLQARLAIDAVVVFGSTARGDFNKWSDIDVLVIGDGLPAEFRAALALLAADAPPGVQPVGWSRTELARRRQIGDPIAREADTVGRVVLGSI
jgi:predicted nucleotidyltransferase